MSNRALPKKEVKCAWSECNETVIIKIGAKYQPKYHSHSCAMKDLKGKTKPRKKTKKNTAGSRKIEIPKYRNSELLIKMAEIPIGFDDRGGKFGKKCSEVIKKIIEGDFEFIF